MNDLKLVDCQALGCLLWSRRVIVLQGFERVALATTPTFDWLKMISIVLFFIH